MKILIVTLVIFAVLLGFGISAYYYIDYSAHTLMAEVDRLEKDVAGGQRSPANQDFSRLDASWKKTGAMWTTLIDHQELDSINITLARVKKFLDTGDIPGFMSELAELKLLLRHIPEKEALNLRNIL